MTVDQVKDTLRDNDDYMKNLEIFINSFSDVVDENTLFKNAPWIETEIAKCLHTIFTKIGVTI